MYRDAYRVNGSNEMAEYTRKTITVPMQLANQMSNVADVNWSQVASEAFKLKLVQLAQQEESKAMDDVINRLRESKSEGENSPYAKGVEGGELWARDHAAFHELERVVSLDPSGTEPYLSERWDGKPRASQLMLWVLGPDHPFNSADVTAMNREELKKLQDDNPTSWDPVRAQLFAHRGQKELFENRSFVRGLMQGAKNIWESVREEL